MIWGWNVTGLRWLCVCVCVLVSTDKTVSTSVSQLWGAWLSLTVHIKIFWGREKGRKGDQMPRRGGEAANAPRPGPTHGR